MCFRAKSDVRQKAVERAVREVFGFPSLKQNQEPVVRAILKRRDTFVVMPTGGGKSLCYQLPAHLLPGTCLVVSPLISLMKDQVDAARQRGLKACCLNSSLTRSAQEAVLAGLERGECDLLYVAPERFAVPGFLETLRQVPLCLFAIDEAHCISEWGHDFRPDYLALADVVKRFPDVPVAAFTATATLQVQRDIIDRLALRRPFVLRASFDRPNLFYRVTPKADVDVQLSALLGSRQHESSIVYRTTRKSVERTASALTRRGIDALPYHAGLDAETRRRNQEAFIEGRTPVVVATIAFGMGIDKPDIRSVIHGDLPKNIESYYQETGRAGRDGRPARCVLFFDYADLFRIRYFIDKIENERQRKIALRKLNEMVRYCTRPGCRRQRLLAYFGERYGKRACQTCDQCGSFVAQRMCVREMSDPSDNRLIPAHGGYRNLRSFQVAEILYDGTVIFCDRFVSKCSRTHDQMIQAARSGRQSIAERSMASATSKKTELKLTNVAKASQEELLLDLEDYLRQRGLRQWDKNDKAALAVRKKYRGFPREWFEAPEKPDESDRSDLSDLSDREERLDPYGIAQAGPEVAANTLICLANQGIYLLKRQIERLEADFVNKGGFSEKLYRVRKQRKRLLMSNKDAFPTVPLRPEPDRRESNHA